MLCDDCKKKPAAVFFKEVFSGKTVELNLCLECAQKRGLLSAKKMSPTEILQKLLKEKSARDEQVVCPVCYLSLAQFKHLGRFGCSNCLAVFEPYIKNLIKEIQESNRHIGKKAKAGEKGGIEIFKLREDLKKALANEAYEQAAEIRDKLRALGIYNVEE